MPTCLLEASTEERYSVSNGRGPTRLISPLSTFQSSGNSSNEVARSKLPKRVKRSESGKSAPSALRAFVILLN